MAGRCPKMARWQISFRVWPVHAHGMDVKDAFEGLTGAAVCDEHAIRDPDAFFTGRGKQIIAVEMQKAGRGRPDFDRVHIIHNEIMGDSLVTVADALRLGGIAE